VTPGRSLSAAGVACALLVVVHAAPQGPAASASALFWAERFEEAAANLGHLVRWVLQEGATCERRGARALTGLRR